MQISSDTASFINTHQFDDVRVLALQASKYPKVDMQTAITQIAGRQIVAEKIPSWAAMDNIYYPKHLSLEQSSSEVTAQYKASLVHGNSFSDLTGGFGVDFSFIAPGFQTATYVERQKELCEIAIHNFQQLHLNHATVINEDGVCYLQSMVPVDCIFIDPARRNEHGGKTVLISDCEPNVIELEELLLQKAEQVMIKLSPMLDLSSALKEMHHVDEVHVISVNNECKELLLILKSNPHSEIPIHCINLQTKGNKEQQQYTFTRESEQNSECGYTNELGKFLFEPNASLLKAGAFKSIAATFGIKKLSPNSHLYTADSVIDHFPGRVFRITDYCGFNKKEIKETLAGISKANITVRNFPSSVAELRKRLKLTDGGDVYLFATTLNDNRKILIRCEKL